MNSFLTGLTYFASETHYHQKNYSLLGITWVGTLSRSNTETLIKCLQEFAQSQSKFVIVNFRDVAPKIDEEIIPLLKEFFQMVRNRPAHIRLSGMHPQLRVLFKDLGLADQNEMVNNLAEALQSLTAI